MKKKRGVVVENNSEKVEINKSFAKNQFFLKAAEGYKMAEGGGGSEPPDPGARGESKMADEAAKDMKNTQKVPEQESYLYTIRDEAPYRVFVESTGEGRINKFAVGSMIRKLEKYRNHVTDLRYLGRNKIVAFFNSYIKANLFVGDERLKEKGYKAYVPRHLISVRGVLVGIPTDITEEEIMMEIESECQVIDVYRLNRFVDGRARPSNRVSVTFRASRLPEKVKLFCCTNRVRPYIQRVLFCGKCHRFNHKTENCKGRRRCSRCSEIHDEDDDNYTVCKNPTKCFYCKSSHSTTDKNCPEREKQERIKGLMAKRNLTYIEAREMLKPRLDSNMYDLLADAAEYPTPAETFAKMTAGKYTKKTTQNTGALPKRRAEPQAPKPQGTVQQAEIANEKRVRIEKERNRILQEHRMEMSSEQGTALNNKYAVTDKERWEKIAEEAKQAANETAERNMRGALMNFYTDLVQKNDLPQDLHESIKQISKQHFKLDNAIF